MAPLTLILLVGFAHAVYSADIKPSKITPNNTIIEQFCEECISKAAPTAFVKTFRRSSLRFTCMNLPLPFMDSIVDSACNKSQCNGILGRNEPTGFIYWKNVCSQNDIVEPKKGRIIWIVFITLAAFFAIVFVTCYYYRDYVYNRLLRKSINKLKIFGFDPVSI
jgi:hypothetical protein